MGFNSGFKGLNTFPTGIVTRNQRCSLLRLIFILLRKILKIDYLPHICLSVSPHEIIRLPMGILSLNLRIFGKYVEEVSILLKSEKK